MKATFVSPIIRLFNTNPYPYHPRNRNQLCFLNLGLKSRILTGLDCKECIYSDLLSQKKDIKRFKAKLEELAREEEAEQARAVQAARDRVLRDFERGQLGLASRRETTADSGKDEKTAASNEGKHPLENVVKCVF